MIDCVYYNEFIRCYRNGVVERLWRGLYWQIVENIDNSNGYNRIKINNKMIMRHRIIAFCFLGLENIICEKNNSNSIDHIDGNKLDNRVDNLRIVSHQQNQWNQTKAKGYCWNKKKWKAQIFVNNKNINLGSFETETSARQAYLDAKTIYHRIN